MAALVRREFEPHASSPELLIEHQLIDERARQSVGVMREHDIDGVRADGLTQRGELRTVERRTRDTLIAELGRDPIPALGGYRAALTQLTRQAVALRLFVGRNSAVQRDAGRVRRGGSLIETVLVGRVVAEAQTNGRMALEYLERRYPERWRKARRLEHTGPGGAPVEHCILWDMGPAPIPVTAVQSTNGDSE